MKKKLFKIALILFIIGCVSGIGTYLYVFHKPHRNIAKEKPAFTLTAENLVSDFIADETSSYEKYGNAVIQVNGEIMSISFTEYEGTIVMVDEFEGVSCSFDSAYVANMREQLEMMQSGDEVSIKGQCDGYDMIMGVVLTRCVLVE